MAQSSPVLCTRLDDSFGPHAGDCRGGFDFTLLFEESILTIVPVTLLLLGLPARLWYLFRRVKKVAAGKRSATVKIVRTSLFICVTQAKLLLTITLVLTYSPSGCSSVHYNSLH